LEKKKLITGIAMKKVLASFLLLITTLTAIQPTLALHFCGGRLQSVAIGNRHKNCCGDVMEIRNKAFPADTKNTLSQSGNTCCATYTVEIATDNFQSPHRQAAIENAMNLNPLLFACEISTSKFHSDILLYPEHFFPPGGLARYSVDLLTFVCIFII
jgi:hypothetical protein